MSKKLRQTIIWFTHGLIAGEFGPDDSRYSRDQLFLKQPHIAAQAMAVFLFNLDGDCSNESYDIACTRVREYIEWKESGSRPAVTYSNEELGISD